MTMESKFEIPRDEVSVAPASLTENAGKLGGLRILTKPLFILGVFLVIYAGFGFAYYQRHSDKNELESSISLHEKTLSQTVPTNLFQLTGQYLDGQDTLARASDTLKAFFIPTTEQGVDISSEIVSLTKQSNPWQHTNIQVIGLNSSPASAGPYNSTILRYALTLSGSRADLLKFIAASRSSQGALSTAKINSLSLVDKGDSSNLMMDFNVYAWPDLSAADSISGGGE